MSVYYPDATLRQPLTLGTVFPVFLCYYVMAVLAILPNTFILKLSLLPFVLWQALRCATGYDCAMFQAQMVGRQSTERLENANMLLVHHMLNISLKSIEWTFAKKPLRRYEPRKSKQDPLVERREISVKSVILDAFDLITNMRGLGWSWSSTPFPHSNIPPSSIAYVLFNTTFLLTIGDASQYIIQLARPAVDTPSGGSLFDPNLPFVPRIALAAFCGILGGVWNFIMMDASYHFVILVGRVIFRQPASAWPPIFRHPWMSTSLSEFWNFRWHQLWRHNFITFGARPGGALFGKVGAVMGAFAASSILHHIVVWSLGNGAEFVTAGGFFLLMGVGVIVERAFTQATGWKVRGCLGWLWMMTWTTLWGTFMMDGWARHGMMASDFFLGGPRPGKILIDAIIARSGM